jgi:hypothetical protein
MGYKFQFITLAGFHALNLAMFELARGYKQSGMTAYSRLQEKEFLREQQAGYEAAKHQRFVGTGYFDSVQQVITSGTTSTAALQGSTEEVQFTDVVDALGMASRIAGPENLSDASLPDMSMLANRWEESDELMPSGD